MILYLDTSALVKLYIAEQHSPGVKLAVAEAELIATSLIAYAETHAALARRHRLNDISTNHWDAVQRDFERDWGEFSILPVHADA